MRLLRLNTLTVAVLVLVTGFARADAVMPIPKNIETRNVPAIPQALAERLARYNESRSAALYGWHDGGVLIGTRFANANQMHHVANPLGMRRQMTFLPEPLADVALPPGTDNPYAVISWDVGGSEFDQLFVFDLRTGDSRLVSDGKSLYGYVMWAPDGQRFVYTTTERNGRNWDTHVQSLDGHIDKVLETEEGFWHPIDWHPSGTRLLMKNRVSVTSSSIHELDLTTRRMRPLIESKNGEVSVPYARYDGNGGVYFTSDEGSEFLRLKRIDLQSGDVETLTEDTDWDVSAFTISDDRKRLAYIVNEGGISRLHVLSLPRHREITLKDVPAGVMSNVVFSPDGSEVAFSVSTATAPSDVYVASLKDRRAVRWTDSEVGGLDTSEFVEPELISFTSFDGLKVPAFYYKPRTPGPHPVVVYIHGGPEAQYRPYFSTLMQSYVNEMNVAVIAPNVRGSHGYGKSYLKLDNGFKREDSVKDIGALLDWIDGRTDLRSDRVAVMGGSYGGYMVLASMVHYGDRLAAAVESVGISSFVTFLENTQPYRQDMRRVEYGDERDPEMRAHLEKISPLNNVEKMRTPVLISQGANDPRVPASESEQIFKALEAQGVPVWYVLAHDEGHGMRKKVNRSYDRAAKFGFLETFLKVE